jgi:hypothetical protein
MWYGWDIIKGNYFMNERELLNHVFAEIIDKVNKLEAKKDKKGEVIQRTPLEYCIEILKQTPHKIIASSIIINPNSTGRGNNFMGSLF